MKCQWERKTAGGGGGGKEGSSGKRKKVTVVLAPAMIWDASWSTQSRGS